MDTDMERDFHRLKRRRARTNLLAEYMTQPKTTHPLVCREGLKENHLRLVRILPRPADSLICCETRILPVSSADRKYIAVSYVWGPPIAKYAIILDGRIQLLATNLWHFLHVWSTSHVTPEDDPHGGWLWVDALCIDQENFKERMHQVRAMSRIFAGAERVLVWLGLEIQGAGGETFAIFGAKDLLPKDLLFRGLLRVDVREEICRRPYWSRLWVFQELKSAQKIELMCGDATVNWKKFKQDLMDHDSDVDDVGDVDSLKEIFISEPDPVRHSAATSMVMLCGQRMPTSLWTLLQLTSHLHCYDPRDKVYALLSIAKTGTVGIDADYAVHLPELMNLVLTNLHSSNPPRTVHEVTIQCDRLKSLMGLEPDFPWCLNDYLATADPNLVEAEPDLVAAAQGSI